MMSKASEIANNVWLGPTPGSDLDPEFKQMSEEGYDIVIEATDGAEIPNTQALKRVGQMSYSTPQYLEFPASGSLLAESYSHAKADPLVRMCRWIHSLAHSSRTSDLNDEGGKDEDGDIAMRNLQPRPRKFLIHCTDGYTETTLLALAYFMYAEQIPLHTALLRLHCEKNRNFFAYPSDILVLTSIQPHILEQSTPMGKRGRASSLKVWTEPSWLTRVDGSLPSRILPHMYLGNLAHANNPDLLREMGIGQILSVGEPVSWPRGQLEAWGKSKLLSINDVQDNGVDSLAKEFDRCLKFIGESSSRTSPNDKALYSPGPFCASLTNIVPQPAAPLLHTQRRHSSTAGSACPVAPPFASRPPCRPFTCRSPALTASSVPGASMSSSNLTCGSRTNS